MSKLRLFNQYFSAKRELLKYEQEFNRTITEYAKVAGDEDCDDLFYSQQLNNLEWLINHTANQAYIWLEALARRGGEK